MFLTKAKAKTVQMKDALIATYKEKEDNGSKVDDKTNELLLYLDQILKTRAYDLLFFEKGVEKHEIVQAVRKYEGKDGIKDLLMQIQ